MLSPALGATTAIWLMLAPALGLQTGARASIALAAGILAFVLSPLGLVSRSARSGLAGLGLVLGFVDLAVPLDVGAQADLATCAVALIVAGAASWPVVARRSVVVPAARVPMPADDVDTQPARPLSLAA